jgi:C-terminal processing protease CtpA/Prc
MILGKRTFGKGSVQNVIPIPRHRAYLKLTTAYYYLPNGRCLHRRNGDKEWGVDPDVEVHVTPRQTKRWLDVRRRANLLKDQDPKELKRDLAEEYRSDLQLQTAVLLLRLKQIRGKLAA